MSGLVYQAVNSIAADLATSGIAKSQRNEDADYAYRGIDDVLKALAPLLAKHKLCILPRVLERDVVALRGPGDGQLIVLRVAFDLVSAIDGSRHIIECFGEALDDSDKGTAKAMSSAYKCAMLQAFCIPVPQEDSDAFSPRHDSGRSAVALAEPPEGWESWSSEVIDIARSCECSEAIDRLIERRRLQLSALQRARPELYAKVGEAIAIWLAEKAQPHTGKVGASNRKPRKQESKDVRSSAATAA